ncbi:hypothetical protein XENORESO_016322, partial [Xenotaenia resolanae]
GAPLTDIAALSTQNISMDVNTFMSLDINVITNLTVKNVRGLLAENLPDLKLFENDTVVQTWVNLQLQSDLDTLGVGLITNRASPTAVTSSNTTGAHATVQTTTDGTVTQGNTNTTPTPSQPATTSGVLELTRSPASVLLAALFTAVLQVLLQPA